MELALKLRVSAGSLTLQPKDVAKMQWIKTAAQSVSVNSAPRLFLLGMSFTTVLSISHLAFAATPASTDADDFKKINRLVQLPDPIKISTDGKVSVDKNKWSESKESDGTELLTSKVKEPLESRVAIIRSQATSTIESFTAYSLRGTATSMGTKPESSASVFFDNGKLKAFTICEDNGGKESLGRTCVTATPKLCDNLKKSDPIEADTMKAVDTFEMRAIATILTLRGADHQLDNVVRTGNRLGLKSAMQTTKGQLMAFSKQITKDATDKLTEIATTNSTGGKNPKREPANVPNKISTSASTSVSNRDEEKKIVASAETSHAALEEDAKVRAQLDHTIPMLQQACSDTGFVAK